MKINKKSWHYKLLQWFCPYDMPRTLCSYFWCVVGYSLAFVFIWSFGIVIALIATSPLWVLVTRFAFGLNFAVDIAIGITIVYLCGVLLWLLSMAKHKVGDSSFYEVTTEYLSAVKDKFCPTVWYE